MANTKIPCCLIVVLSLMVIAPPVGAEEKWVCLTNTLEKGQLGSSTGCYFSKKSRDGKWIPLFNTGLTAIKDGFEGRQVLCSEVVKPNKGYLKCRAAPCCYDGSKMTESIKENPDRNKCKVGGEICKSLNWSIRECWTWWQSKHNFAKFGLGKCPNPKSK